MLCCAVLHTAVCCKGKLSTVTLTVTLRVTRDVGTVLRVTERYLPVSDNNTFCTVILYIYSCKKTRRRSSTFCNRRRQPKLNFGLTGAGPDPAKAVNIATLKCSFESMQQTL